MKETEPQKDKCFQKKILSTKKKKKITWRKTARKSYSRKREKKNGRRKIPDAGKRWEQKCLKKRLLADKMHARK